MKFSIQNIYNGKWEQFTAKNMDIDQIDPPHEPVDMEKLDEITESMRANGWLGLPLVVFEQQPGRFRSLTGSHRLAAARAAGMRNIPVVRTARISSMQELPTDYEYIIDLLIEKKCRRSVIEVMRRERM